MVSWNSERVSKIDTFVCIFQAVDTGRCACGCCRHNKLVLQYGTQTPAHDIATAGEPNSGIRPTRYILHRVLLHAPKHNDRRMNFVPRWLYEILRDHTELACLLLAISKRLLYHHAASLPSLGVSTIMTTTRSGV